MEKFIELIAPDESGPNESRATDRDDREKGREEGRGMGIKKITPCAHFQPSGRIDGCGECFDLLTPLIILIGPRM